MLSTRSALLFVASALLVLGLPRRAQAQAADTTARPLTGSVDLGLVAASGNTDLLTFSFRERLAYRQGRWTVTQGARMVNGQTDGVESANEYGVDLQAAYALSQRWSGFVLGTWDRNTFLGIEQRFQQGLGLTFAALDGPKHHLALAGGFSLFQQTFTGGVNSSFPAARGQVTYKYAFTPKAYIQNIFVYLPNLEDANDYRMNNELALVAPVAGPLALKASYTLQYQNVPQPGFGTTDNLFTTGLQVTF